MSNATKQLLSTINRMDTNLDVQWGRIGLMQRWLDDHSERLDKLSGRIAASLARLDALQARTPPT